jgi:hypothetical protein
MSHYKGAAILVIDGEPASVEADLVAHGQSWWGLLHLYTPSPLTERQAVRSDDLELLLPSGGRGRLGEVSSTTDGLEVSGTGLAPFGEPQGMPELVPAKVPGITAGLVSLEEARRKRDAGTEEYDGYVHSCGEAWFHFGANSFVCLSKEGTITGYSGVLFCASCGERA